MFTSKIEQLSNIVFCKRARYDFGHIWPQLRISPDTLACFSRFKNENGYVPASCCLEVIVILNLIHSALSGRQFVGTVVYLAE